MSARKSVTRETKYSIDGLITLADLRRIMEDTGQMPEDTIVDVRAGDSQMDGAWCNITIRDA